MKLPKQPETSNPSPRVDALKDRLWRIFHQVALGPSLAERVSVWINRLVHLIERHANLVGPYC